MYSGWKISNESIERIQMWLTQAHPDFIGHHVTFMFGKDSELPPEAELYIVGQAHTDDVQVLVVSVNGSIKRPDGGTYHLTWSIDKSKGAKPVDSNKVLAREYPFATMVPWKIEGTPEIFN